jgi:hypothetical protein
LFAHETSSSSLGEAGPSLEISVDHIRPLQAKKTKFTRVHLRNGVFCQLVPWQYDHAKQYNLKEWDDPYRFFRG